MKPVVDPVVDIDEFVDNHKKAIGNRIKAYRSKFNLTQKDLADEAGIPLPSLRDYELGKRTPGGDAIASLLVVGINANWLLAGEGPMLLADLMAKPEPPKLNVPALTAILEGLLKAGAPPDKAVAAAFEFYQINIDRGLITAEGIGVARKSAA